MPILNPKEMRAALGKDQRLLGVDPGKARVGLALSDTRLTLASPLATIKRRKIKYVIPEIRALLKQEDVGGIVAGLPLSLDGTHGPAAQAASDWAAALGEALNLPVSFCDERLSSAAVNRFLIRDADMTRSRRSEVVDKMAAAYILQTWLELPC